MSEFVFLRFTNPTRFVHAPFGTICKVQGTSENDFQHFIQLNKDEEFPSWHTFGEFLDIIFREHINDSEFVNLCLKRFQEKDDKSFHDLVENYL